MKWMRFMESKPNDSFPRGTRTPSPPTITQFRLPIPLLSSIISSCPISSTSHLVQQEGVLYLFCNSGMGSRSPLPTTTTTTTMSYATTAACCRRRRPQTGGFISYSSQEGRGSAQYDRNKTFPVTIPTLAIPWAQPFPFSLSPEKEEKKRREKIKIKK